MPNHYTNRLTISGSVHATADALNYCKGDKHPMDFEKIVPSPQIIKEVGEISSKITTVVEKIVKAPFSDNDLLAALQTFNRAKTSIDTSDWNDAEKESLEKSLRAYKETGCIFWYDWNLKNWGTKWNAYGFNTIEGIEDAPSNQLFYLTANGNSVNVVLELSKKFPNLSFNIDWASEDTGYSCGNLLIIDGEIIIKSIPKGGSREAYELSFELNPEDRAYYILKNGEYTYIEE